MTLYLLLDVLPYFSTDLVHRREWLNEVIVFQIFWWIIGELNRHYSAFFLSTLDGEEIFRQHAEQDNWSAEIIRQFALWINACLKWRFKSIQQDFATPEYNQWCRDMEQAIAAQARLNK